MGWCWLTGLHRKLRISLLIKSLACFFGIGKEADFKNQFWWIRCRGRFTKYRNLYGFTITTNTASARKPKVFPNFPCKITRCLSWKNQKSFKVKMKVTKRIHIRSEEHTSELQSRENI